MATCTALNLNLILSTNGSAGPSLQHVGYFDESADVFVKGSIGTLDFGLEEGQLTAHSRNFFVCFLLGLLDCAFEVADAAEARAHILLYGLEVFIVGFAICGDYLLKFGHFRCQLPAAVTLVGLQLRNLGRMLVNALGQFSFDAQQVLLALHKVIVNAGTNLL